MGNQLYVGNLSFDTSEDALRALLSGDGRNVKDVHIVTGEKGRPRGFAFAEMESEAEAQAAIEALNGTELNDRTIKVNEARERTTHSSGFGDRGGFRSGSGSRGGGGGSRGRRRSGW